MKYQIKTSDKTRQRLHNRYDWQLYNKLRKRHFMFLSHSICVSVSIRMKGQLQNSFLIQFHTKIHEAENQKIVDKWFSGV